MYRVLLKTKQNIVETAVTLSLTLFPQIIEPQLLGAKYRRCA
jgi:hypothetical protein